MGTLQSREEKFKQTLEQKLVSIYPSPHSQIIKTMSRRPTKMATQAVVRTQLQAQPMEGKNGDVVHVFDGRKQIHVTTKWPYSVHGLVTMKFKNITCWGTGIMIGPNIVLTAGHYLYNYEDKEYADLKNIQFLPGMNGQVLPFGLVEVEEYFVSPNFIKKAKEDYGILILKEPVGEMTGYFGLACLEPEEIKTKKINITGYPADKVESKSNTFEMWGMEGEAVDIDQDQGLISHLIDTSAGQSGSGVWYQEGENFYVCGVHVSGTSSVNHATLLTRAMYEQIYKWLQQVRSKESLLQLGDSKELNFKGQEITRECLAILMNYKLDDLTVLDLSENNIDAEGLKVLAQNTSWINLSKLNLSKNKIDSEGANYLAQMTSWTKLSKLDLSYNKIGAEGVKSLAQNTSWRNLSQLNVSWNNIGAEGAKALAQSAAWVQSLQEIKSSCGRPTKPTLQNNIQRLSETISIQRKNQNVLNAFDQRIQVHETKMWPNSVHGVVTSKFKTDNWDGTGVLIGPKIVLTSGHNLYNYKSKTYADLESMQFLPGMNGLMLPFGFLQVEKYFVSPNYIKEEKEDYGLLILKEPIGEMTGYFGLACLEPEEIKTKRINVTGYPADKVASKPHIYEMWGMEGVASCIDKNRGFIEYVIDTGPGQSGSGVWYQEGEDYYVCGIHAAGGFSVNYATLLTKAICEQIYRWVQESLLKFKDGELPRNKSDMDYLAGLSPFKNRIEDLEAEALAQKIPFIKLSELNLSGNNIGREGAKALAENTSWANLSQLNLSSNNIGVEGTKAIAQNVYWMKLSELDLRNNNTDEEGKQVLRQNQVWEKIHIYL